MLKKSLTLLAALALAAAPAMAETYLGTTVAQGSVQLISEAGGALESLDLLPGQRVEAGEVLGSTRAEEVFAAFDGTVALCHAGSGDSVDGAVLEIAPTSRYTVYCTVEGAYGAPDAELVHSGEQLYLRCTANGTHRAVGIVTAIDGEAYQVEVVGGELYVGETVYLYRDADFTSRQRVGIGTAVSADSTVYEASGTILELCVDEGEAVERGELLFTYAQSESTQIVSPVSGIIASVAAGQGDELLPGQAVAEIVPTEDVRIEILVDEVQAARITIGQSASYIRADDPDETPRRATIERIFAVAEGGQYRVILCPDEDDLPLGLRVEARIDA